MRCLPKDATIIINSFGSKISYKSGNYHSFNDQPAYRNDEDEIWYYKEGLRHRDYDKPSILLKDGSKYYYKEGEEYFLEDQE